MVRRLQCLGLPKTGSEIESRLRETGDRLRLISDSKAKTEKRIEWNREHLSSYQLLAQDANFLNVLDVIADEEWEKEFVHQHLVLTAMRAIVRREPFGPEERATIQTLVKKGRISDLADLYEAAYGFPPMEEQMKSALLDSIRIVRQRGGSSSLVNLLERKLPGDVRSAIEKSLPD